MVRTAVFIPSSGIEVVSVSNFLIEISYWSWKLDTMGNVASAAAKKLADNEIDRNILPQRLKVFIYPSENGGTAETQYDGRGNIRASYSIWSWFGVRSASKYTRPPTIRKF